MLDNVGYLFIFLLFSQVDSGMFTRSAPKPTKADLKADLFDIFGAPMASKPVVAGNGVRNDSYNRSNSPSSQHRSYTAPGKNNHTDSSSFCTYLQFLYYQYWSCL